MKNYKRLLYVVAWLFPVYGFAQQATDSAAAPSPDFWHRQNLTGNWGGARSRLMEKGVALDFGLTQFYQGVASGGISKESEYNGKFQTGFKFDLGKLVHLNHWLVDVRSETRFGGPLLTGIGALNPVNTAVILPGSDGTVFSITAANITKIIPLDLPAGELIAVSAGRFNFLDLAEEPFYTGSGITKFFNLAENGPLTCVRQVPLITNAVNFAYLRKGAPFITFNIIDPNDHSTDAGLSDLFADGVTFGAGLYLPSRFGGKSGTHSFTGFITTKEYTPFDALRQLTIPGPPAEPIEPKGGSWSVSYTYQQYLVERAPKNGWGLFASVAFADKVTSPVSSIATLGLGGNGLFKSRGSDEFGLAYSFSGLSQDLQDGIDGLRIGGRPRDEHQVELFYNLHLTPWFRLTGDVQYIRPVRPIADAAIVPGARLQIVF